MRVALLAALVALAVFFALAALVSWAAVVLAGRLRDEDPLATARRLFLLRAAPTITGLLGAALAVLVFVRFEPAQAGEWPGLTVLMLAAAGTLALGAGLWRAAGDLLATRRLLRAWLRDGRSLVLEGAPAPVVRISHPFPLVCVVGLLRPRILVAEAVLRGLSRSELRAVMAHERAHLAAADNLRRLFLRACPPLPWPTLAARLERRWQDASEEAADVRADAGFDLASALVATARLAPPGARLEVGAVAFHGGALARRVGRLCEGPPAAGAPPRPWLLPLMSALTVAACAAAWPSLAAPAYQLLEALVHLP
jgi:hypothetical protein